MFVSIESVFRVSDNKDTVLVLAECNNILCLNSDEAKAT